MHQTFILVTQEAEKLGAKHRPIFFETPCTKRRTLGNVSDRWWEGGGCYLEPGKSNVRPK